MNRQPAETPTLRAWIFSTRAHVAAAGDDPRQCAHGGYKTTLLTVDVGDDPKGAVAQIELVRARYPGARVAVMADYYHRVDLVAAYRAGANACFVKDMTCGAFIKTIGSILNGETVLPPELLPFIDDEGHHKQAPTAALTANANGTTANGPALSAIGIGPVPRLSTREKCILRCMVGGDSNKVIARKIDISEATVKVHVKAILRKIRLSNRTQAAIWAMNNSTLVWSADAETRPGEALMGLPSLTFEEQNGADRSARRCASHRLEHT
jgi:two-component system nitrate/nitrite response regulator NarL